MGLHIALGRKPARRRIGGGQRQGGCAKWRLLPGGAARPAHEECQIRAARVAVWTCAMLQILSSRQATRIHEIKRGGTRGGVRCCRLSTGGVPACTIHHRTRHCRKKRAPVNGARENLPGNCAGISCSRSFELATGRRLVPGSSVLPGMVVWWHGEVTGSADARSTDGPRTMWGNGMAGLGLAPGGCCP